MRRSWMKSVPIILLVLLTSFGCGRFLAAVRRHTEIDRPITAAEMIGTWVLTTNSLAHLRVDGFKPNAGEHLGFIVRTNGTYSSHTVLPRFTQSKHGGERTDQEGTWSLDYNQTNAYRNTLFFRTSQDSVSSVHIALDGDRLVIWESWGDPDDGIDLVFEKMR